MSRGRPRSHLSTLVFALGCSRPGPPPPPAPTIEQPSAAQPVFEWQHEFEIDTDAGSFAVVPQGAGIWTSPRDAESAWTYAGTRDAVVKVIGLEGEFVEVSLDWEPRGSLHCHKAPILDLGLRVFVRQSELADVVTRPALVDHGDGTGIIIAPGASVSMSGTTATVIASTSASSFAFGDQNRFEVGLDTEQLQVGKFYVPAKLDELALERKTPVEDGWLAFGASTQIRLSWKLELFARSEHDSDHVVIGTNCLRVAGFQQLDADDQKGGHGGLICGGVLAPEGTERWQVPIGTELTWPNGEPAGTSFREVVLEQSPLPRGSRRCFVPFVGCEWVRDLSICIAADALIPLSPIVRGQPDSP